MKYARFALMIGMVALIVAILSGPAQAGLEDILYEKGQITKEEWLKAKADAEKAAGPLEKLDEWQKKVSKLPILSDKFNIGLNVMDLQFLQNEAPVQAAGSGDNRLFIRRAELIAWGKINDYLPRWHMVLDFAAVSNITANVAGGSNSGILKEAYGDIVPALSLKPYINRIRIGEYRIPVALESSSTSGLIDFVNRNYITSAPGSSAGGVVGTTTGDAVGTGVGGTIEFVQERDTYVSLNSKPFKQLELDLGIMNGNGVHGLSTVDNNSQKDFFGRARVKPGKDMFFSFSTIAGKSTNLNSRNGGRGLGNYDRYIADFRITPEFIPGLWFQGEFAWGHDAPAARTTSPLETFPAGSRGVVRTGWYVYGKYLFQSESLKAWELGARYEEFDPSTHLSEDMMYRTTFGINYHFANLPPKVQAKLMLNYEIRRRGGNGPNTSVSPLDEFGNDALLLQLHIRML